MEFLKISIFLFFLPFLFFNEISGRPMKEEEGQDSIDQLLATPIEHFYNFTDWDNDGGIDVDELLIIFRKTMECKGNIDELRKNMKGGGVDANEDGKISWSEFMAYAENNSASNFDQQAAEIFQAIDVRPADGALSVEEIVDFAIREDIRDGSANVTAESAFADEIGPFDRNGNGKLEKDELKDYVKRFFEGSSEMGKAGQEMSEQKIASILLGCLSDFASDQFMAQCFGVYD